MKRNFLITLIDIDDLYLEELIIEAIQEKLSIDENEIEVTEI